LIVYINESTRPSQSSKVASNVYSLIYKLGLLIYIMYIKMNVSLLVYYKLKNYTKTEFNKKLYQLISRDTKYVLAYFFNPYTQYWLLKGGSHMTLVSAHKNRIYFFLF